AGERRRLTPNRALREPWRGRTPQDENAVVLVSRAVARARGATRWRAADRSHLYEQPHGELAPDYGHILSPNEITFQNPDGRSGVSFRHLCDQNTDNSSRT